MKKPFNFRNVDPDKKCLDCNAPFKLNLLSKNPNALRCYTCNTLKSNNLNINRIRLLEVQKHNILSYKP